MTHSPLSMPLMDPQPGKRSSHSGAYPVDGPAPCHLWVGNTAINEGDIAQEMQYHRAASPHKSRAEAARALVVRALLALEAERLGLMSAKREGDGQTLDDSIIGLLLEREVDCRLPDEADCLRYFQQNQERFRSPDRMRVRHVLLAAPPDDVAARLGAREQGEHLISELKRQPALFADFAHRYSSCPSASEGGDLGWLERGQTTPEFDRQVFRLRMGLADFPVESRWGYHVVSVDAAECGVALPFESVRERISDYLELQLRQRELQRYLLVLQERYEVRGLADIEAHAGQS